MKELACLGQQNSHEVAHTRAKVVDLDNDAVASVGELLAGAVGLYRQLVALATVWTGTTTRANAEEVLRGRGGEARVGVEAAGAGGCVAVRRALGIVSNSLDISSRRMGVQGVRSRTEAVTGTVLCERGFVGLGRGANGQEDGGEDGLGQHVDGSVFWAWKSACIEDC